jgi:hypothetical protein
MTISKQKSASGALAGTDGCLSRHFLFEKGREKTKNNEACHGNFNCFLIVVKANKMV